MHNGLCEITEIKHVSNSNFSEFVYCSTTLKFLKKRKDDFTEQKELIILINRKHMVSTQSWLYTRKTNKMNIEAAYKN